VWILFFIHFVGGVQCDMRTSEQCIAYIEQKEGFRGTAYLCPTGHWTLGFGDTVGVRAGQTITREDADFRLRARLVEYENAVEHYVDVPLTQNEFDACVSLVYNIGSGNFATSSVRRLLNAGLYEAAALAFKKFNKGRKVDTNGKPVLDKNGKPILIIVPGLVRRREEEKEIFLHGFPAPPSP
jgi:lysozyme